MKKTIKSLTLSVDEIRQLIEITDPEARRQVMQSLVDGVENPAETIDRASYAGSHPMALTIAKKISRKAKAAARRETMKNKRGTVNHPDSEQNHQTEIEIPADDNVIIEFTDVTVNSFLWLNRNHQLWCRALHCVISSMKGSDLPRRIHNRLRSLIDSLFTYLTPLINQAADYRRLPKAHRPRFASASPRPLTFVSPKIEILPQSRPASCID